MRRLALVLALLALGAPAPAQGAGPYQRNLAWAAPQAQRVMPTYPVCPQGVRHVIADDPNPLVQAWVVWPNHGCAVYMDRDYLPDYRASKSLLCATLAHEYGHLRGLEHFDAWPSLMSTYDDNRGALPRACRARS